MRNVTVLAAWGGGGWVDDFEIFNLTFLLFTDQFVTIQVIYVVRTSVLLRKL